MYARLRGTLRSRASPTNAPLHPKQGPFSEPDLSASAASVLLRASPPSRGWPCGQPVEHEQDVRRPIPASQPPRRRAPILRALPVSLRGSRLASECELAPAPKGPVNLAFHDARFASAGLAGSRRRILPSAPDRNQPLAPLSHPVRLVRARAEPYETSAKAASRPLREEEDEDRDPRCLPSRGCSCTRMSRCRFACGHVSFRCANDLSVSVRPPLPRRRSRTVPDYDKLDPRPRGSIRLALLRSTLDTRFSGSGYRPSTSATALRRMGTTHEHPIPVPSARITGQSSPFEAAPREGGKHPARTRIRKPSSGRGAACGRHQRPDPRLRRRSVGGQRWTATGRAASSEGPSLRRLLPQGGTMKGSPPRRFARAPLVSHRFFQTKGWRIPSPS